MPELYLALLDRILTPVLLVLAVVLLLAGHNTPGGGFIAGLVVASAFLMQVITRGDVFVRNLIGRHLQPVMGAGLVIAVLAAALGLSKGVFFTAVWWKLLIGTLTLEIGTPVLFDLGVFLVVSAVVTSYILEMSRPKEE